MHRTTGRRRGSAGRGGRRPDDGDHTDLCTGPGTDTRTYRGEPDRRARQPATKSVAAERVPVGCSSGEADQGWWSGHLHISSDYGVTVDDFCYWGTSQDGSESLFAGYAFHYRGAHDPKLLHFVAQDNFGHNTDGYVGASWFNSGFFAHDEGVNAAYSFSGQRVVLNVYLLPAVNNLTDDNAANNRAEVTIYVPNQPAPAYSDPALRVNCVVDYGTTF